MPTDEKVRIVVEADTQDLDKKLTKSQKRAKELNDQKLDALEKQFDSLDLGLKKFTKDQVKQVKVTKDQIKNLNLEKDSYFKLQAQMNLNKKILKSLSEEQVKNEKIGGKLRNTINKQADALKSFDKGLGDNFRNVGNYTGAIKKMVIGVLAGVAAFKAISSSIGGLISGALDLDRNVTLIEKRFNTTREEAKELNIELTAMSKSFGVDFNEEIKAVNVLMKEFGVTSQEAVNLLKEAAKDVPDQFNALIDQVIEYSSQLKQIGIGANQFLAISTQALQEGVFSDKGLDSIKEFNLRIREMTPAAESALKAIGFNASTIVDQIETGQKTVFQVLKEVSARMAEQGINAKTTGQALADLFGGAGEDAGDFILKIDELDESLANTENQISKTQEAQAKFNEEVAKLGIIMSEKILPIVTPALEKIGKILETITLDADRDFEKMKDGQELLQGTFGHSIWAAGEYKEKLNALNNEANSTVDVFAKLYGFMQDVPEFTENPLLKPIEKIKEEAKSIPPIRIPITLEQEEEDIEITEDLTTGEGSKEEKQIADRQAINDLFAQMNQDAREAELAKVDEYYAQLLEKAGQDSEAKLQVEEMHNAAVSKIDKKYSDLKARIEIANQKREAKQFGANLNAMANQWGAFSKLAKRYQQGQALIDTYKAANGAYSAMASIPYVGPILGAAAAAAAIAAGLANVAQIENTKFSDGGVLQGPSHAEGGIQLGGNQEAEGDEIILTKAVYRSPEGRAMASALNQEYGGAAIRGASAKVPFMQDGGVVAGTQGQSLNMQEMTQRIDTTNMLLAQQSEKLSRIEAKTGVHFNDEVVGELSSSIDQSVYESTSRDNQEFQSIGR